MFPRQTIQYQVIQVYAPVSNAEEAEVEQFYEDLQDLLEITPKKRCPLHYRGLEHKSRSQEIPGVRGKFGLGEQNEAGQGSQSFAKRTHWSWQTPSFNNTRDNSTHGHHQIVNTKIRLTVVFAAKDGEALYSRQKQDWELTVAQIMNSLLPSPDVY